jgi:F1F0 ATPase subunit 2
MSSLGQLLMALGSGAVLGAFFFGGLWWTIRRGLRASAPALWFLGSLLVRSGSVIAGFLWLASGDIARLIAGLLGFLCVRAWVQYAVRGPRTSTQPPTAATRS